MALLFLGARNATRSALAEALARHLAPALEVYSAGLEPSHVHPQVRRTLDAAGVDPRGLRAQSLLEIPLEEVTDVVLLCAPAVAPLLPPGVRLHRWSLPDPASAPDEDAEDAFDAAREELERRLPPLLSGLRDGSA